jgi:hypothetical protein
MNFINYGPDGYSKDRIVKLGLLPNEVFYAFDFSDLGDTAPVDRTAPVILEFLNKVGFVYKGAECIKGNTEYQLWHQWWDTTFGDVFVSSEGWCFNGKPWREEHRVINLDNGITEDLRAFIKAFRKMENQKRPSPIAKAKLVSGQACWIPLDNVTFEDQAVDRFNAYKLDKELLFIRDLLQPLQDHEGTDLSYKITEALMGKLLHAANIIRDFREGHL